MKITSFVDPPQPNLVQTNIHVQFESEQRIQDHPLPEQEISTHNSLEPQPNLVQPHPEFAPQNKVEQVTLN